MSEPDPSLEKATALARRVSGEAERLVRRARRRRLPERIFRAALWMVATFFIVIPAMIAGGFLLGPYGVEGVVTAPLVLFSLWGLILYRYFGRGPSTRRMGKVPVAQLPATTGEWLEGQRDKLPPAAQSSVDRLMARLDAVTPQLQGHDAHGPAVDKLRSLLIHELPQLMRGYRKIPTHLRQEALYGGASPERQLLDGLDTIERQVTELQESLARDDLRAFATHKRYLELKYKGGGDRDD